MNKFYVFTSSSDSLTFYPDNQPFDLKVHLPEISHLSGTWTCSLLDLKCVTTSDTELYVFADILEDSLVNSKKLPLIQYVPGEDGKIVRTFGGCIDPRLSRNDIGTIHIYITDVQMKNAPLTGERTT